MYFVGTRKSRHHTESRTDCTFRGTNLNLNSKEEYVMDIKDLKSHLDAAHTEVKNLVERQSDEIKTLGQTSEATASALKEAEKNFDNVTSDFEGRMQDVEKRLQRPAGGIAEEMKSAGEQFIESNAYKMAIEKGLKSTDAVEVAQLVLKDISSGAGSAGAVATSMRRPGIIRDPADRQVHIRDLMNVAQTSSGSIEYYVDYTGFDNQAGAQTAELATKNKSDLVLEEKTAAVKTIAHHVIASRQVLDDASMLRSYIDGRLRYGLSLEEDKQLLYGDGTGGTLEGIFSTTGVQDQGTRAATDDYVTHIRKAMTKARLSNYPVNGIVINPQDWETIELLKNDGGDYIWIQYMAMNGEPRMFRVPVIETNAVDQGDFVLGNWNMAATLWDRQQASVRLSDSHADLFVRNGVAILGEERVALTVERPSAFVKGDFTETV
jgi:HK97 family phage major capsid protein